MSRKIKDRFSTSIIYAATAAVILVLFMLIAWVFATGFSTLSWDFLTTSTEPQKTQVTFEAGETYNFATTPEYDDSGNLTETVTTVSSQGPLLDNAGKEVELVSGVTIEDIDGQKTYNMTDDEAKLAVEELKNPTEDMKVILSVPGGGIYPLIITTLFVVFFSLVVAIPFGLFAAIYLIEYDVNPKVDKIIHFAINSLAGIPSIIFALFGTIFFVNTLNLGKCLLAGILTVTIMLLPIVIKTIEEALKSVPDSYREASYGLGATKSYTIFKVILPSALPGIIVAIILATGRVIGESAIFVFVVGTTPALPSFFGNGATLSVYAYYITRETPNINVAAAIAIVIIVMVLILNISAKLVSRKFKG